MLTSCLTPWVQQPNKGRNNWTQEGFTLLVADALVLPKEKIGDTYWKTPIGDVHLKLLAYTSAEFFRSEFDSTFENWQLPKGRRQGYRELKSLVAAEATLWAKTWHVMERLASIGKLPEVPIELDLPKEATIPIWLYALVSEYELLMSMMDHIPEGESKSATDILHRRQSFNRSLQTLSNPSKKHFTQIFLDSAIAAAEQYDQFRKNQFLPMVRARMTLTKILKEQGGRTFDLQGNMIRQGRTRKLK